MSPARPRSSSRAARTRGSTIRRGRGTRLISGTPCKGIGRSSRGRSRRTSESAHPAPVGVGELQRKIGAGMGAARFHPQAGKDGDQQRDDGRIGGRAVAFGKRQQGGDRASEWRRHCAARRDGARRSAGRARHRPARAVSRRRSSLAALAGTPDMSRATRMPMTAASSSELLASRLAPCRPVEATSPQAQSPGTEAAAGLHPWQRRPCDSERPGGRE